jgi:outer membrane protein assembly factor BamB
MLRLALLLLVAVSVVHAADWPQWMGPNRDDHWTETGILDKFPAEGPKFLWRQPIAGGFAGPAVADGRVYVTDYATKVDFRPISNPDRSEKIEGKERVHCFDARTGKELWKHEYDCSYVVSYPCGPRCTPTVSGGKVYTLGTEGNLFCLDAAKGTVLWSKELKKEYETKTPLWGFSGHPLVDGKKLICVVGGKGSVAVAFDKDTGKELWKAVTASQPGYCPPSIIEAGGKRQLLIWDADNLNALDPESGAVYWSLPVAAAYRMSIAAPRKHGNFLFVGGIGHKGALIELAADKPAAKIVTEGTAKEFVYPINSTPIVDGDMLYGVNQDGALVGARFQTGERLWSTFAPCAGGDRPTNNGTAFLIKNGDRYFLFSETGHLIIAKLTPEGYKEIDRAKILEPTGISAPRDVVWSHPAFANKCMFARNDKEIVCVSLEK